MPAQIRPSQKKLTVAGLAGGNLGQIPVVVSLHFQIEDLALGIAGFRNQVLVQQTLRVE